MADHSLCLHADHKPLLFIFNPKAAVPSITAARMQRWAMFLSAHQYTIEHKCGKSHANADFYPDCQTKI